MGEENRSISENVIFSPLRRSKSQRLRLFPRPLSHSSPPLVIARSCVQSNLAMLVRKGFSTEVCRDYATRHASNTREGGHQMSLGLVLVPVTSQLCVATINLPCPPKSLSRYYFVPTGKYLPLPHSLSPFRPLLSSRGRVSLSTFPRHYYRDEKWKKFVSERLLLNRTRIWVNGSTGRVNAILQCFDLRRPSYLSRTKISETNVFVNIEFHSRME